MGVYGVEIAHEPFVKQHGGDVMARLMMRCRETLQSADYVLRLLDACDPAARPSPDYAPAARSDALAFGLVEGWRGEICHVTLTDAQGALRGYKIRTRALHNWLALALAVRGRASRISRSATRVSTSPTADTTCKKEHAYDPS